MGPNDTNFCYLNREGGWLGFHWDGLELRDDGGLQLIALPRLETPVPAAVSALPMPTAPAGIAIQRDGSVFYSAPDQESHLSHRRLRRANLSTPDEAF